MPITTLLYALNFSRGKILDTFYEYSKYEYDPKTKSWFTNFEPNNYSRPIKLLFDLIDKSNNKKILQGQKLNLVLANKLKEKKLKEILVSSDEIIGKYTKTDIKDQKGEIILKSGFNITQESLDKILKSEIHSINLANLDPIMRGPYMFETMKIDKNNNKSEV